MHVCIHRFTWLRYILVCIYPSCVWVDVGEWVGVGVCSEVPTQPRIPITYFHVRTVF